MPKCLRATEAAMPMVPARFGSSFAQRGYDRVKRIECRKIDDIAWIGKTGVRSHHQHDHAAHGDIQQKQQPCRCMIASAFQFQSATAIANDQKVDRNPLIDADASAKSKAFEAVSRNRRCSSFLHELTAHHSGFCPPCQPRKGSQPDGQRIGRQTVNQVYQYIFRALPDENRRQSGKG